MITNKKIQSILAFLECDESFLNELLVIYKEELKLGLATLKSKSCSQKQIKSVCHKLSGTALLIKLDDLYKRLKASESLAEQNNCSEDNLKETVSIIDSYQKSIKPISDISN